MWPTSTVIADGESVHLIAGEDVRYSLRAGVCASSLAALLLRCDGRHSLETLLLELSDADRSGTRPIIERLYGERLLIDGPVENNMPALKLHPNSRKKADRRVNGQRRQVLRFESDRRSGKTRRPQSSWDNGKAF